MQLSPGGGMISNTPGGSALGWRHLFNQVDGIIFELHIFEYDEECALKWQKEHPHLSMGCILVMLVQRKIYLVGRIITQRL